MTALKGAFALLLASVAFVSADLQYRAFPNAPDGYTPKGEACPPVRPSVRSASSLSPNETSWLEIRRNNTVQPMHDLLGRLNINGFDAASYITNNAKNASALPNIALAFSGGGYRACLNGGGAVQAFDSREVNSTAAGHLGGLLQSATYLAGLSGGGWLVGSIYVNNFTTISGLLNNNDSSVWEFQNSILEGPSTGGLQVLDSADYYKDIDNEVSDKADAGFQTSVTDYWGRALSFQLVNATDGGSNYTWSSIQSQDSFSSGDSPMPILVSDGRAPGETLIPGNTTIYEFNPFEFGTWDPTTYGFVPLEYLGSNFSGGILNDSEQCVRGFDNVGYVMGTSSSLFNQFLVQVNSTSIPSVAKTFVSNILTKVGDDDNDIADYTPNPFYGYNNATSRNSQNETLTLVDGGEDLENIPLHPLIQPFRHVDVIFAVDSSADTNNYWPNGSALVATYQRSIDGSGANLANGTSFPAVPDQNTFVNLGLNTRPTFFGCNSSNTTTMTPLIVYIPNSPYVYQSNISTFDLSYNTSQRDAIVQNGYYGATMGNGTVDTTWPTCVGCAILSRSMERTNTKIPAVCTQCFQHFCWDGTVNSTNPAPYEPTYKSAAANITSKKSAGERERTPCTLLASTAVLVIMMLMGIRSV
ncbi:Lysophospholipase 1 [Mycoblastus sanguinarius]|nr:Lysophospholipase 1 [Mycoblastus sanguinarius]